MDLSRIVRALQSAGLTQTEIAERSGLAQSTVSQLATGARGRRPSLRTAEALCALAEKIKAKATA